MVERQTLSDQLDRVYRAVVDLALESGPARVDEVAARSGYDQAYTQELLAQLVDDKDLLVQLPPGDPDLGPRYRPREEPSG